MIHTMNKEPMRLPKKLKNLHGMMILRESLPQPEITVEHSAFSGLGSAWWPYPYQFLSSAKTEAFPCTYTSGSSELVPTVGIGWVYPSAQATLTRS